MKLPEHNKVRRILIRAVNWIGDAVMTTPAIGAVREFYPQAEITVLANPLVAEVFSPHEWVDKVMVFDRKGAHQGVRGRLRLAAELRKCSFDMAIILPNSFDSALVPWLAGIPVRLGKGSDGRSLLLTGRYSEGETSPLRHEVQYYRNLVRHFGIMGKDVLPRLCTTPEEDRAVEALLAGQGIQAKDNVIGINPGATYGSAKRWYPDRFAEVAGRIASAWRARIVIFGSLGEAGIAADIEQRLEGGCLNIAGKTTVRELMALIKRCNFMVTNDSGPMHIAAAFGVPLAAIFGPTDHTGTAPYTVKATIVRKGVACAPCKLRECPTDHRCMTAVTADDVVAAALALVEKRHG
ncbi:lipopolysaccharide heptosyltransferase II [Geobacter sp. AOG2]|uniref:lipopolysaccharide heptosyltransferase II n=1 Tax=Geobacter sp. AOG2 TaxID=1566347 RepID=UPI001CC3BC87|nr:lipopolysaccharide heptosyltransferase II [Geobacter sp. AOG2]GFE62571.1 ADP-heptose-LPS heptosyltransferase [Geobacter sp. AOG2]